MYAVNGNDVLDFKINFKVTRLVRKGLIGLRSKTDELVILNDGKYINVYGAITMQHCQLMFTVKGRIESGTMTALLGARYD